MLRSGIRKINGERHAENLTKVAYKYLIRCKSCCTDL